MLLLYYSLEIIDCNEVNNMLRKKVTDLLIIEYVVVTIQLCYENISGGKTTFKKRKCYNFASFFIFDCRIFNKKRPL